MLRNHFYKLLSVDTQELAILKSSVRLNSESPIFEGHFPEIPVVPGVCMLQMLKEQLEDLINKSLQLVKAANIKFLAVINPLENPEIQIRISYVRNSDGTITADGEIFDADKTFFKITKAIYKFSDGES